MANYNDLITAIDSVIKTNNRREITGQLLQNVLNTMVGSLGENYQLAGFATPTTNPHQPDQNVFYVASQAGVYTQFDNIVLGDGISFLMWKNGAWTSQTISIVTQSWVQQNYVSKEWFRKVFRVYDEDGLEIVPNDMDSVVDNIKAMVGLWTNEYLSALGMGRDGGGSTQTLAQLNDVQLGTLENGDALVYNTAIHKWENKQIQTGVDMSVVWAALAANTNEQINASHLATALSGYVTTAALGTALQNYATQSWVNQNFITVEWFDKLFQLYNGTEAEANKITPNGALPVDQSQLNIEAMFGFWTKKYISALGQGDDGTAGAGDVTWALLATQATDGRTIHLSYISAALASYLSANNYLQSSAIADMATQTWVGQQGYLTSHQPLNYINWLGNETAMSGTSRFDWTGLRLYGVYNNGYPTTYGNVIRVKGYGSGELLLGWNGDNTTNHLYYHSQRDTEGSYWGDWVTIIDSSNIGSQSVSYASSAGSAGYATSAGNADTVDGYHESDFLHLTGGTMTGDLVINKSGAVLRIYNGDYQFGSNTTSDYYIWSQSSTARFRLGTNNLERLTVLVDGKVGIGTQSPSYLLDINGISKSEYMLFKNYNDTGNAGYVGRGSTVSNTIYLCGYTGNDIGIGANNSSNDIWITTSHNVGIGTVSPSYKLDVSGTIGCSNLYSTGAVSALSDIRHKEIVRNTNLQVEQIAAMRSVIYRKKDSNDNTLYAGSIAQDWQSILPQVVSVADNDEHTQSLQYGVAALIAVITTARKVVDHERRIADLERENERLKEIINNLKIA